MWPTFSIIILIASITEAIPRTDVTVSGLSSGGAMTAQLHLVFSSTISGSGVLAGPPYYCAEGRSARTTECLYGPAALIPVEKLISQLQSYVSAGTADPTSNLKNDPVYIFSGRYDPVVLPDIVKLNEKIFSSFGTNIKTNYEIRATHGFITDNFGGICEFPDLEYFINNWYAGKKIIPY
jgi:predicted esterase